MIDRGYGRSSERSRLEGVRAVVAAASQGQTRVLSIRRGVLEVERKLFGELRKKLPGQTLTGLKSKAGVW